MPEWSIGPHSKCGVRATVPRVRIPVSPPRGDKERQSKAKAFKSINLKAFLRVPHPSQKPKQPLHAQAHALQTRSSHSGNLRCARQKERNTCPQTSSRNSRRQPNHRTNPKQPANHRQTGCLRFLHNGTVLPTFPSDDLPVQPR